MQTETMATAGSVAIWERVIVPEKDRLSLDEARYLVGLKFPPADTERMNELAAKARAGTLTNEENEELDNYIHVGQLLGTLQSRARQVLKKHPTTPR